MGQKLDYLSEKLIYEFLGRPSVQNDKNCVCCKFLRNSNYLHFKIAGLMIFVNLMSLAGNGESQENN